MTKPEIPDASTPRRQRNRRGQGGQLRDELIAAARGLLASAQTESELTIRGVTRAAGVHPQAFYLHFENLDALLYAVYAAGFAELTGALHDAAVGRQPGEPALRAICQEYGRFALAQPARYRLLMSLPGQPHPDWDSGQLPGSPALQLLRQALADARVGARHAAPSRQQAPGHSPDQAVILLWATLHGLVTLRTGRPTFPWPPLDQLIDQAVDTTLAFLA
jgi:AcrR family transcriptional regulator